MTHIAILRFSALGDVAMVVPVLRCLYKQHPEVEVTFITKKFHAPLFEEFPQINLLYFDPKTKHKGIRGLWRLFKEIKKTKPTAIADLHGVLRTSVLQLFFKSQGFLFSKIDKGRTEKRKLTRTENKVFEPLPHSTDRYVEVFKKLGLDLDLSTHEFPQKPALPNSKPAPFQKTEKKWIGIAPFASFDGKVYPMDLMQEVVETLQKEHQVFLFGAGPKELQQLEAWENTYKNVFTLADHYTFSEELRFIAHLDLMISMDSANAHFAANVNTKVLTLWGITHPYCGFSAWGQPNSNSLLADRKQFPKIPTSIYGNKIPEGYQDAFRSIHPEQVIEKAKELLA